MTSRLRIAVLLIGALALTACLNPRDRCPGLWLRGEVAEPPADWSFTDAHREIAIEVRTPYGLRHSVTIWCAQVDGQLYVGARAPETKRWPGWVDRRPEVRLGIAGKIYPAKLAPLGEADDLERLGAAYARKYELPPRPSEGGPLSRYWRVEARGG